MRRWRMSAGAGALAVLISLSTASPGAAQSEQGDVRVAPTPLQLADFELLDQDGHPFRFSQRKGGNALIFFGFTHCPDICPATLHKLKLLTDALRQDGGSAPAVIMISVDGDRDTPAALKAYLAPLSKDFIGLTGDRAHGPRDCSAIFQPCFSRDCRPTVPGTISSNTLRRSIWSMLKADCMPRFSTHPSSGCHEQFALWTRIGAVESCRVLATRDS